MTGLEVLSNAEMRSADQAMIAAGTPGVELMERAGRRVTDALLSRWSKRRVVIACGPGNNGGDGFVVARHLTEAGVPVELGLLGPPEALSGDAAVMAERWQGDVRSLAELDVDEECVFVDALFGTGLSRPVEADAAKLLTCVRNVRPRVLAIDLPSGLNGDEGALPDLYVDADMTVTFARKKFVHVLEPAASACGDIVVGDIGISETVIESLGSTVVENHPRLWRSRIPWPSATSHKHARGRLFVVTGGVGETGAARLAARAGLRAGAGLSTLLTPPSALLAAAVTNTAVMTQSIASVDDLRKSTERATAVVIGPAAGVTDRTREFVLALLADGRPTVLDADALTAFASDPSPLFDNLMDACVLTPHQGEFERLFPGVLAAATNKADAARRAAQRCGAVVLLKGPDTVVASPNGDVVVNRHATPFLSTAGSGDVLAGVIGGFLAQGMSACDAAAAAAWVHGDTGLRLGPGLIAEDLVERLPESLSTLYAATRPPKR